MHYSLFKGVGDRANTDLREDRRIRWLDEMQTEWETTMNLIIEVLQARAKAMPADHELDVDVVATLGTNVLLHDAAIATTGVQVAIAF